jgi:hypothetical protein
MGVELQRVERLVHIVVAKPLAWALYAIGVIVACLALASLRGLRSLIQRGAVQEDRSLRKERQWQRQSWSTKFTLDSLFREIYPTRSATPFERFWTTQSFCASFGEQFEMYCVCTPLWDRFGWLSRAKTTEQSMRNHETFIPFVLATIGAGCLITVIGGEYVHWIPILLALGVVAGLAQRLDR